MLISCGNFVRVEEQEGENQLVWVLLIVIGNFVFEDEVVDGAAFIHERRDKLKDEGDGAIQYRYLFTPKRVGVLFDSCIGKCWSGRQRLSTRRSSEFSYEQQRIRELKRPVVGRPRARLGTRGRTPSTARRVSRDKQG